MSLTIGLWNVQWASPNSARGRLVRESLGALDADVLCVTEGFAEILPGAGHIIDSDADYGYAMKPRRRKVLLWSRRPWHDIDWIGSPGLPTGRFASGITDTPRGPVRFVGACVPWRDAHVRTGRRDRAPWEDHLAYLANLPSALPLDRDVPMILLGDFNQRLPRSRQPKNVFEALRLALPSYCRVISEGAIADAPGAGVDHIALCGALEPLQLSAFNPKDSRGREISDHFGLLARLQ